MTTIAYKDGIVAYDSRLTKDNVIIDDNCEKVYESNGLIFFITGTVSDFNYLMASYLKEEAVKKKIEAEAIVIDGDDLYHTSVDENGDFWRFKMNKDVTYAIGSGSHFALAFMDSGISAEEAIYATMKRDCFTGGKVRTYQVEKVEKVDLFKPSLYENYEKHKRAEREHK